MSVILTDDQKRALAEIIAARAPGARHLLTGYAGSGKTTLMQAVARAFSDQKLTVAMTAPTHKAVSVLSKKLAETGLSVPCVTIHNLLSLQPYSDGPKTRLRRRLRAQHVKDDVVILDECSMVDSELMAHIEQHLHHVFVLFVGDPAQLPPVGEKESPTFAVASKSHLDTIVRQAAGNPILGAAHVIRSSQGGALNMSWCKRDNAPPYGVFLPNGSTEVWMEKAFKSDEFKNDNDTFRYLCWTNSRVAEVNRKVRRWIYGDTNTPYSVGESVLIRAPILSPINPSSPMEDRKIIFNTNDEAPVVQIERDEISASFHEHAGLKGWNRIIPAWRIVLKHRDDSLVAVKVPRVQEDYDAINDRLVAEAKLNGARWGERHEFAQDVAKIQSIYAITCHNAQGNTFRNVFVDVGDILRRSKTNLLEAQQMLYVAATRPTHALMLVNTTGRS